MSRGLQVLGLRVLRASDVLGNSAARMTFTLVFSFAVLAACVAAAMVGMRVLVVLARSCGGRWLPVVLPCLLSLSSSKVATFQSCTQMKADESCLLRFLRLSELADCCYNQMTPGSSGALVPVPMPLREASANSWRIVDASDDRLS